MTRWNPWAGPRVAAAWSAALAVLADGEEHDWADLIPVMAAAGPVLPTTAANILRDGSKAGVITYHGRYHRATRRGRWARLHPTAEARFIAPPGAAECPTATTATCRNIHVALHRNMLTPTFGKSVNREVAQHSPQHPPLSPDGAAAVASPAAELHQESQG